MKREYEDDRIRIPFWIKLLPDSILSILINITDKYYEKKFKTKKTSSVKFYL